MGPQEANLGFDLNGVNIMGKPLKVGRPNTYQGLMTMGDAYWWRKKKKLKK